MTISQTRFTFDWKPVKGNIPKRQCLCPRCNNQVDYFLAWDGSGVGFPGIWTIGFNKVYAYKCPICPNYEAVNNELAKAIIKG